MFGHGELSPNQGANIWGRGMKGNHPTSLDLGVGRLEVTTSTKITLLVHRGERNGVDQEDPVNLCYGPGSQVASNPLTRGRTKRLKMVSSHWANPSAPNFDLRPDGSSFDQRPRRLAVPVLMSPGEGGADRSPRQGKCGGEKRLHMGVCVCDLLPEKRSCLCFPKGEPSMSSKGRT